MAVPKEVKVGASDIEVRVLPDLDYAGQLVIKHNYIEVCEGQGKAQEASTLLHECLHAIFADRWTFYDHHDKDHKLEEKVVRDLESGLAAFIKDNPKVIKYFQENL
jgi:hypothetical protein